jgi:hypothetical protein
VTGPDYEAFRQACIKACPDALQALPSPGAACCMRTTTTRTCCRPATGPGSSRIPRSEARQLTYAMNLLKDCQGCPPPVRGAGPRARACASGPVPGRRWGRVELSRAINLCDQALRMIEGARAADGERGVLLLRALSITTR